MNKLLIVFIIVGFVSIFAAWQIMDPKSPFASIKNLGMCDYDVIVQRYDNNPAKIQEAFTSGKETCAPEPNTVLQNVIDTYGQEGFACSTADLIVRYNTAEEFVSAIDSGEEQCEIPLQLIKIVDKTRRSLDG